MCKVSVIIPVYNSEPYIKETLESVVNQTLEEIEIIVVNDGSTDNSQNIIDEYCRKHDKIVSLIQKNSGVSTARNNGLSISRGEYIAFVDSDDILPIDSIELRYRAAIDNDADVVTGGAYKFNSKESWPIDTYFLGDGYKDIVKDESLFYTMISCNKLFRKSCVKNISFDSRLTYGEDQVFVTMSYFLAEKIYAIDDIIYYYREREGNSERSLTQLIFDNPHKVLDQTRIIWDIIYNEIEDRFDNKFIKNNIRSIYLNRLTSCDIWPPIKQIFLSKNESSQIKALDFLNNFINNIDSKDVNNSGKLKWIVIVGILEHYRFLQKKAKKVYVDLLKNTLKKLDGESVYYLNKNNGYLMDYINKSVNKDSSKYILHFLVRRKLERVVKFINNKLDIFLLKVAFLYGKCTPISKNKVTLATIRANRLVENFKMINDELAKHDEIDVRVYLKENKLTKRILMKMYYDFATSKIIILDDYYRPLYNYKFKKDTEIIQVWHACGAFKRFAFSAIDYLESHTEEYEYSAHSHYTKVITSGKEVNKHYAEAFRIREENVLSMGVPRTDIFFDEEYKKYVKFIIEEKYPIIKNKKVILYAPTFRGGGKDRQSFDLKLDLKKIIEELGKDYIVILKLHPAVKKNSVVIPKEYKENILNLSGYSNINDLLLITDILITDYSSVVFEYSLLEKPMIFFAYDLDSYMDERNFYYEYKEFTPGAIAKTNDEIINIIKDNKLEIDKIKKFKDQFLESCDGKSTERLVDFIIKSMEE